ncbi:uncharacterized protein LOC124270981 [Haliotis rubra]|uniref:uncharacterized protein LOC124270981 n=1 Tax=Haliotis rubra TaxID=36100 RepID=UPI001EE55500|nr:uncharacterized protein LOC124270981 [Haliotis rubra]
MSHDHSLVPLWQIPGIIKETEHTIIRQAQMDMHASEIQCLQAGKNLPKSSPIRALSPILDENDMLRVGGRLGKCLKMDVSETNHIILPKGHHVTTLIIRYYHANVKHQGRHFTEGAVRSGGFWVIGGKRMIASIVRKCIPCRRLRGKLEWQKMSDLPLDRLKVCPPFSYVGVDAFGPWEIVARRTRGGLA